MSAMNDVADRLVELFENPPEPLVRVNGNNPVGGHYEVTHGSGVLELHGSLDEANAACERHRRSLLTTRILEILAGG